MRTLSPPLASLVGVVLNVALFAGALALQPLIGSAPSFGSPLFYWHNVPTALVNAVLGILPGFAAGFLASRRPLLVGCVVGAAGCALQVAVVSFAWGLMPMAQLVPTLLVGGLIGAATQAVSALAGAYIRSAAP